MNHLECLAHKLQTTMLSDFPEIKLVYLFGSQVNGNIGPLSDYDFGIWVDDTIDDLAYQTRLTHAFITLVNTARVDVVLLNHVPIELAYAVIAQGKLLYQCDIATRVEYEAQVMSRHGDYLPVLRAQRDQLLFGENYDARIQRYRAAFGRVERTLSQIAPVARQNARRL